MKRVVGYARVSTGGQAEDGFSIDAQRNKIYESTKKGDVLIEMYSDRGISGKSMENRPELMRLMYDAENGKFDEVVVYKTNRIARNQLDLLKIINQLESYGVTFRSVTEPFDTSDPIGKFVVSMLGGLGELERVGIVENVKNGMKQRARQGLYNGGRLLGYKSVAVTDSREKSRLEVVPNEAEGVKLMFNLYVEGKGYKFIANRMNDLGYKTINGNNFSIQAVRTIITNPVYAGFVRFNNYVEHSKKRRKGREDEVIIAEGNHEPIINRDLWERAQELFMKRSKKQRKVIKGVFLLTGLLRCPDCGSSMVAGRVTKKDANGITKRYQYYQCSRFKNYGRSECKSNSVGMEYAERYVLDKLNKFSFDESLIEDIVGNINEKVDNTVSPILKQLKKIDKELNRFNDKQDKILEAYENGIIDQETLSNRLKHNEQQFKELEEKKKELEEQIEESQVTREIPVERVKSLLRSFGTVMSISTREQKKLLLNLIIEKITVNEERKIGSIELKLDKATQKHLLKEDSSYEESSSLISFKLVI